MEIRIDRHNVGYLPMRGDTLRTSTVQTVTRPISTRRCSWRATCRPIIPTSLADRRFRSANRWPADLPGFRETVVAYCDAMERLVQKLVPLYALALGLPAAYFDGPFRELPVQAPHDALSAPGRGAVDDEFGIAPHWVHRWPRW